MKIAVFHNLPLGGAKRTLYEQIKWLSKNHKTDLFEFTSTDESFLDVGDFAANLHRYPFKMESNLPGFWARLEKDYQNFIKLPFIYRKVASQINKGGYNAALVHADKYTQAPFILKYLRIPSLYFCQEYLRIAYEPELAFNEEVIFFKKWYEIFTRGLRKRIDRNNAKASSVILANSRFTKKNIDKAFGVNSKACHLGVDPKIFKPCSDKKGNYILLIGEKSEMDGFNLVQESLKMIDKKIRPDIKVLGFSKGKLKVADDKVLAKEYSGALACVCTSFNEPFGLVPIESMACGTVVLAVNEGGYRETVVDNKTGFLLKRNPKEFAKKMVYLIKHPKIAKKMGEKGRKHVKENFNWEKHGECIERELEKLI